LAFLSAVLDLLAERKDRRDTAETVLGVFQGHKVKEIENAAARALLKSGYDKAFDELAPSVYEADWQTQDGFVEGVLKQDAAHAFDRLGRFLDPAGFKSKNHVAFAGRILETIEGHSEEDEPDEDAEEDDDKPEVKPPSFLQKDPRWVDATILLLDQKELHDAALDVLAKAQTDRARDGVIAVAAAQQRSENVWRIVRALNVYRDPRIPPLLIRILDKAQGWARRRVFGMLREYDDASLAQALRTWAATKKKLDGRVKEELEATLQFLERDRALAAGV
jgi:hypothetical protein